MNEENFNKEDELELTNTEGEANDEELTPLTYDISIIPADYTLEVLYSKWNKKEIVIPKFQRSYVWNIVQASRLIESFMMGLPIPPVFFYIQLDQKNLVIDGRQRLQSIFYFFDGYFGESDDSGRRREFRLEGINPESRLYRKRFQDFEDSDKRQLLNTVLRTVLVKQLHPKQDHTSIYHIFERLNTGGTSLQDQEVRNCIFSGKLNTLFVKLNKYESWRAFLGKPKPDVRQKDIQLILRYMSLFHNSSEYQKPMKDFLSTFMDFNKNPSDSFLEDEEFRFKQTCDLILKKLGPRPLNPKGALNPSFFDSVFIAFSKHLKSCPDNILERFEKLKNDPIFLKDIGGATTDTNVVQNRLKIAEHVLFG